MRCRDVSSTLFCHVRYLSRQDTNAALFQCFPQWVLMRDAANRASCSFSKILLPRRWQEVGHQKFTPTAPLLPSPPTPQCGIHHIHTCSLTGVRPSLPRSLRRAWITLFELCHRGVWSTISLTAQWQARNLKATKLQAQHIIKETEKIRVHQGSYLLVKTKGWRWSEDKLKVTDSHDINKSVTPTSVKWKNESETKLTDILRQIKKTDKSEPANYNNSHIYCNYRDIFIYTMFFFFKINVMFCPFMSYIQLHLQSAFR